MDQLDYVTKININLLMPDSLFNLQNISLKIWET